MCEPILKFCAASTRPQLYAAATLTALLALALSYSALTTHTIFGNLDPALLQSRAPGHYLQVAASTYLLLITLFTCYAAHYDQKHLIGALAILSSLNLVLALSAIFLVPSGAEVANLVAGELEQAAADYDFADKSQLTSQVVHSPNQTLVLNLTLNERPRLAEARQLNRSEATLVWDRLQGHGCCGLLNATATWKDKLPKSCCSNATLTGPPEQLICKELDEGHKQGCLQLISSTSTNLVLLLALLALTSLYTALVSGFSAYRTFHYNEANQNAYS